MRVPRLVEAAVHRGPEQILALVDRVYGDGGPRCGLPELTPSVGPGEIEWAPPAAPVPRLIDVATGAFPKRVLVARSCDRHGWRSAQRPGHDDRAVPCGPAPGFVDPPVQPAPHQELRVISMVHGEADGRARPPARAPPVGLGQVRRCLPSSVVGGLEDMAAGALPGQVQHPVKAGRRAWAWSRQPRRFDRGAPVPRVGGFVDASVAPPPEQVLMAGTVNRHREAGGRGIRRQGHLPAARRRRGRERRRKVGPQPANSTRSAAVGVAMSGRSLRPPPRPRCSPARRGPPMRHDTKNRRTRALGLRARSRTERQSAATGRRRSFIERQSPS